MGTGLLIAAGLCITARHVVDECLRIYQGMDRGIPGEKEDVEGTFHVDAFQFWDGETSVRWSVKQMHTSAYCDIAYLHSHDLATTA